MTNKFGRALDHLTKTAGLEYVLSALQAVEDLFSEKWLTSNGKHRLQLLWDRKDSLATNELFSFGKSINRLKQHNLTWLESTANEIKKNIDTSHGLITEIIMVGSLSSKDGVVSPCTKSYPIYDYTIDYPTGFKYKVSVKNFDISIHEKHFHDMGELIRKTFINYLETRKISGHLQIVCDGGVLTRDITNQICMHIVFSLKKYGTYLINGDNVTLNFQKIPWCEENQLAKSSDAVMILAKQHFNEQRNIESKLRQANESLLKDSYEESSVKKLIVRIGETTDINKLKAYAENLAQSPDGCGFDMCLFLQPKVISANNSTEIVTTVCSVMRSTYPPEQNIANKFKKMSPLKMDLGVGSLSDVDAPFKFTDGENYIDVDLSSYYLYQKGDIYLKMKKDGQRYYGELKQLAPGIVVHAVFQSATIKTKIFPDAFKLLII